MKKNKQVNRISTKLIRIEASVHKLLKVRAANEGKSIRELLEAYLADMLSVA